MGRVGDDVRDERHVGLPFLAGGELSIPLAVFLTLPIDGGLGEARVDQAVADLGQGVVAPVVLERPLHLGPVLELEVDVAEHRAGDGVVAVLVPDIGEAVHLSFFLDLGEGVRPAVVVEDEHAVLAERLADRAEVLDQPGAGGEDPVAEVHGQDGVGATALGPGVADIALEQRDPRPLLVGERREVVLPCPLEGLLAEVDADGLVPGPTPYPLAGRVGGPAEVLADGDGLAAPDRLEGLVDEVDLGLDILDALAVEHMPVRGGGGELGLGLAFLLGSCHGAGV